MKIVCVGDAYVTTRMMQDGVSPYLKEGDSLETFFFGLPDREAMRDIVRTIETGGRERLQIPEGLMDAVRDAELLIVHLCPVNAELLQNAGQLKAVMSCRGGLENIDVDAAARLGIIVSNNPAHNANAVAEYTVGLILCETRNICRSHSALVRGEWRKQYPNSKATIRELCDLCVGIIGFGAVGRLVAAKLKPFGCRLLIADPFLSSSPDPDCTLLSKEELLARADIVSLHARAKGAIIGDAEFAAMKDGAWLINTARAYLVDTEALHRALDSGKLMGAALDVFDTEPDIPDFFRHYDNVTITSHRAGDTINSYKDAPGFAIRNYLGFLEGRQMAFRVKNT